jgi:hypothetical protein
MLYHNAREFPTFSDAESATLSNPDDEPFKEGQIWPAYKVLMNYFSDHPDIKRIRCFVDLTVDKLSVDKLSVENLPVDKLSVENLPVDKLSVDKLSVENLPVESFPNRVRVPHYCDLVDSFEIIEGSCIITDYRKISTIANAFTLHENEHVYDSRRYKYDLLYNRVGLPIQLLCYNSINIVFDMIDKKAPPTKIRIHGWFVNEELHEKIKGWSSECFAIPTSCTNRSYRFYILHDGIIIG